MEGYEENVGRMGERNPEDLLRILAPASGSLVNLYIFIHDNK